MPIRNAFSVLWRHKWLISAILLVTMLAIPLRLMMAQNEYTGTVKMLVTAPESITVDLLTSSRSSTVAEEINIARNNFVDVIKSEETRRRVINSLNLPPALQAYKLSVNVSRETDFLTVAVTTVDGEWAAQIANEHVAQSRQYFGEVRAQPAALAKVALAAQVADAAGQLKEADQALVQFKNDNSISSVDSERDLVLARLSRLYDQRYTAQLSQSNGNLSQVFPDLMRTLDSLRSTAIFRNETTQAAAWDEVIAFHNNQILAYAQSSELSPSDRLSAIVSELESQRQAAQDSGQTNLANAYAYVIAFYSGELTAIAQNKSSLDYIDQLIAEQEAALTQLNVLTPQYDELVARDQQAQSNYKTLSDAYQEAVIKEDTASRADFIQVVLPAAVQSHANTSNAISLILLGLVGALGTAIVLAFVAELLGRWLWPAESSVTHPRAPNRALDRR